MSQIRLHDLTPEAQEHPMTKAAINTTRGSHAVDAIIPTSVEIVVNQITPNSNVGVNSHKTNSQTKLMQPIININKTASKPMQIPPPVPHLLSSNQPTPVEWQKLEKWLMGYPTDKKHFLISGYKYGFKVGLEGCREPQDSPNLKSASESHDIVSQKLASELQAGRIAGPHTQKTFKNLKISPLGVVPKKNPGEYRLIHHLSFPKKSGLSVNENIGDEFASVTYAGIQEAILRI